MHRRPAGTAAKRPVDFQFPPTLVERTCRPGVPTSPASGWPDADAAAAAVGYCWPAMARLTNSRRLSASRQTPAAPAYAGEPRVGMGSAPVVPGKRACGKCGGTARVAEVGQAAMVSLRDRRSCWAFIHPALFLDVAAV
ncbi:hypothetical protein CU100_14295 [Phyllobacterium endophyticum]|uniref:Uncharacterized protein n=1 Tax=Phyllobacterium endophyticum TaxID=1149773 RepID=A0A2P7AQN9_9HYPH|nr:hypothetical protein CU100_14295 [Phyllobacterium endophyticum]